MKKCEKFVQTARVETSTFFPDIIKKEFVGFSYSAFLRVSLDCRMEYVTELQHDL